MVYAKDLKSFVRKDMSVRVRPAANKKSENLRFFYLTSHIIFIRHQATQKYKFE